MTTRCLALATALGLERPPPRNSVTAPCSAGHRPATAALPCCDLRGPLVAHPRKRTTHCRGPIRRPGGSV
jgi:hypothetical protein